MTPYQRLLNSKILTPEQEKQLQAIRASLNPFVLKDQLEKLLKQFFFVVDELRKM
jgi:hypothetical protein